MQTRAASFFWIGLSLTSIVAVACGGSDGPNGSATSSGSASSTTSSSSGAGGSATTSSSSSSTSSGQGGDHGMPSDTYPAPHPAGPHVEDGGGQVLKAPKVVPVFFQGDDAAFDQQVVDFVGKLVGSKYWESTTGEYGVGPLAQLPTINLMETAKASLTDADIQAWLADKVKNDPAFPQPGTDSLVALFYPAGTTISLQSMFGNMQSCQTFGGYHGNITVGGKDLAYAVMPRCSSFDGMLGIDAVTATASHEFIEAATDPYPYTLPAYGQVDADHFYWGLLLGGGEVGDMCAADVGSFLKLPEIGFDVQRTWSNAAAKAGHEPCVPADKSEVYFNAALVLNDTINIATYSMKGVKIPVGKSKEVEIDFFSDAKMDGPWDIEAIDLSPKLPIGGKLTVTLDKTSGQNGEKAYVNVKVEQASQFKAEVFAIRSKSKSGVTHNWFGLVGN